MASGSFMENVLGVSFLLVCMVVGALWGLSGGATGFDLTSAEPDDVALILFKLTNDERVARGIHPLHWDDDLTAIARAHSEDMAAYHYCDHVNLWGDGPEDRARRYGYPEDIGENVIMTGITYYGPIGYSGGSGAVAQYQIDLWMDSSGHRSNILDPEYTRIGVGAASGNRCNYATQTFW